MASFVLVSDDGTYINMDAYDWVEMVEDAVYLYKYHPTTLKLMRVEILDGAKAESVRDWLKLQGRPIAIYGEAQHVTFDDIRQIFVESVESGKRG